MESNLFTRASRTQAIKTLCDEAEAADVNETKVSGAVEPFNQIDGNLGEHCVQFSHKGYSLSKRGTPPFC